MFNKQKSPTQIYLVKQIVEGNNIKGDIVSQADFRLDWRIDW
jgi:hypothetical protein